MSDYICAAYGCSNSQDLDEAPLELSWDPRDSGSPVALICPDCASDVRGDWPGLLPPPPPGPPDPGPPNPQA